MNKQFVRGWFNFEELTVKLGHELSTKNPLKICKAVKVPDFTYTTMETADAGGGWSYGYKEEVERTMRNAFIIIYNNEVIGWMDPYRGNIKSDLYPMDWKHTRKEVKDFAESYKHKPPPSQGSLNL